MFKKSSIFLFLGLGAFMAAGFFLLINVWKSFYFLISAIIILYIGTKIFIKEENNNKGVSGNSSQD